ncbi:hypothetical protein AY599_14500 [Leptolyngbya valderiana BDU 20041]|nr:hypothetical protein [Geitlerinema sp. CS-897]OAB62339.1 hypothetical protein AY599_14500 [Leptolyngbya valderiana BDU 20041]
MKSLWFVRVVWGSAIALGALGFTVPLSAYAQTEVNTYNEPISNDPFADDANTGDRSQFEGEGGLNMFDIIHRANMGSEMTFDEFVAGQEAELDDAAQSFRDRQLQLIRQQNPASPEPADTVEMQ